jgi:hypothetical protein
MLVELVTARLAIAQTERMVAGRRDREPVSEHDADAAVSP